MASCRNSRHAEGADPGVAWARDPYGAIQRMGTLSNGKALLNAAEEAGFELLLTTDRRIRYQQNLRVRRIALIVLTGSTRWSRVRQHVNRIAGAVASATPGSYSEIEIPSEPRSGAPDI